MINQSEAQWIRNKIFHLLECSFLGKISIEQYSGVRVTYDGENAVIGCQDKITFSRGLFLLAQQYEKGAFQTEEHPCFETVGAMLDMSRNGVMKTSAVKQYMEYMAALGMNTLMLYTEDTFELENYPRFGYLRGRYTVQELREIDDYAEKFGIEVVPCVQTLGHMEQYLQWSDAEPVKDTASVLLCDSEETYLLIEEMIKTMKSVFRSKRIHINMDEAHDVGLGKYLDRFGYQERFEILLKHLNRVYEICKKYDYQPMMSSDMFFRLGSKTHVYYDTETVFPEGIAQKIPDVSMVYWDYNHTEQENYDKMIQKHAALKRPIVFYGSIWTWEGFLEDTVFSLKTSVPALKSCIQNGIREVYVSMWGDDGAETDPMTTVGTLPVFSEFCYKGENCTMEQIAQTSEQLTKIPFSRRLEMAELHADMHDYTKISKKILYTDLFYQLADVPYDYDTVMMHFKTGLERSDAYRKEQTKNQEYFNYCHQLFQAVCLKCELLHRIPIAYRDKDVAYLQEVCENLLPELIKNYNRLHRLIKQWWLKVRKPNGLEVLNIRFGGIIAQMEYQRERIRDYLEENISLIEELEERKLQSKVKTYLNFPRLVTPMGRGI